FFFQAEDGIRDFHVTGVQTCALPILGSRQPHDELGALPELALDANVATHQASETPRDREAEAGAARAAGEPALDLVELLEDTLALFARDARAAVLDADLGRVALEAQAEADRSGRRELERVREQVDHDLG